LELILEGFNYRANVWLNGVLIADSTSLIGPFRIYHLDITQHSKPKDNIIVIEVFPPQKGDLTIGWVDWNPYPPDDNMGLWRPVKIKQSGHISLHSAFVETTIDKKNFKWAELKISADI
jgi:exo-1,4-beta-D-glucosaminidase